ncbi:MAG: GNAT family N-acetyltransferase [Jatrophihabitantaceae bacterium]
MSAYTIREAKLDDLVRIIEIAAISFPEDDPDRKAALPGVLGRGVNERQVLVAVLCASPPRVVGYLQYHYVSDEFGYHVEGVAVDPAERGHHVSHRLFEDLKCRLRDRAPEFEISMTVSPHNREMIKLAFDQKFFASDYLPNYFAEGQDRLYFRFPPSRFDQLGEPIFLPIDSTQDHAQRMSAGYVLTSLIDLPQGPAYCARPRTHDEVSPLRATEAEVSFGVSAALLGAFAILFGLALPVRGVPIDIIAFLAFGLISATLSMLVYGKSSGELSRLRNGRFNSEMQMGNLVSEFGCYYPLILIIPVEAATLSHSTVVESLLCLMSSAGLAWYHLSGFAMIDRYFAANHIIRYGKLIVTLSPAAAFGELHFGNGTAWWTVANILFLASWPVSAVIAHGERVGE